MVNNISIGNNCVLHTAATSPTGLGAELLLKGDNVIQNNCTLYSCTIEEGVYVGHNSVILEGAILQKGAIIAPNSVVPPGRVVKERQVWAGNPIKYVRRAKEQENFVTLDYARYSNINSESYNNAFLPYKNAYLYRHGSEEVSHTTCSPSRNMSVSMDTNSTSEIPTTIPLRLPITATDPERYHSNIASNKNKNSNEL